MVSSLITLFCVFVVSVAVVKGNGLFSEFPETKLTAEELKHATDSISDVKIRMTNREVALFQRYLSKATNYFEFGCGGSTMLACKTGPAALSVTSVDSSQEWIDIVMNNPLVADKKAKKLLAMSRVDIGPVGSWGYPNITTETSKGSWYLYSQAISSIPDKKYDLVLVDGRFRIACLLHSYITNPQSSILIHDFFDPGHHQVYKTLLDVSEIVDRADTLVALRIKSTVHKDDLMKMYATHVNNAVR